MIVGFVVPRTVQTMVFRTQGPIVFVAFTPMPPVDGRNLAPPRVP